MSVQEVLQTLLPSLGLAGGAVSWLYQVRTKSRRDKIKLDLDILEKAKLLLGDADERTQRIQSAIERRMDDVYGDANGKSALPWADLLLFLFCAGGVAGSIWGNVTGSKGLDLALAGVLGFIGAGALMNAFDRKRDKAA